MSRTQCGRQ